eukprot:m.112586 g.112586  ORF g.112586 m.112586 type:complete len:112 (-) comp15980_c1_seq6:2345-2680(-)
MSTRPVRFVPNPTIQGTTAEWYKDRTGSFTAGYWTHPGGLIEVTYNEEEFCVLLEGKVRLTGSDGTVDEYSAGEAFIIPTGFVGKWETLEPVRKWYVIWAPADFKKPEPAQ